MALIGYNKVCGPRSGGGITLWLASKSDVASFTLATDEKFYDTVTMEASAVFTKYEFDADTCGFVITPTRENRSKKYEPKIEWTLGKLDKASRNAVEEIMDASDCGLIGIVEDANGQKWVCGYSEKHKKDRPLEFGDGTIDIGKALSDGNVVTISLMATSGEMPRAFDGEVPVVAA